MTARGLRHRSSVLWIAALVHRLSGLALAIFLPVHFLTLGLAIQGEAHLGDVVAQVARAERITELRRRGEDRAV